MSFSTITATAKTGQERIDTEGIRDYIEKFGISQDKKKGDRSRLFNLVKTIQLYLYAFC